MHASVGRSRHHIAALGVAAAALIALCSCSQIVGYRGNSHGPKVALIGDSITVQMEAPLKQVLEPSYRVIIKAKSGQRLDQRLPTVKSVLHTVAGPPDLMVIDLGTNDALQNYAGWGASLTSTMGLVANVKCVVFLTVNQNADIHHGTVAAQINQALQNAVASRPNFHILDWNALLRQDGNAKHWLSDLDGIHLSPEGTYALALQYLAVIRACPR